LIDARPEERDDFKIADIKGHTKENRHKYVAAVLTIARGWFAAKRPTRTGSDKLTHFGGFEAWSNVVRQMLVWEWVGLPDPNDVRKTMLEERDVVGASWRRLLYLLGQRFGGGDFTCRQVVESHDADLSDAIREVLPRDSVMDARTLGMLFHHAKGRLRGGRMLVLAVPSGKHAAQWRIEVGDEKAAARMEGTDAA
jgi:hypothetical protein